MGVGIAGWEIVTASATSSADKTLVVTCSDPATSILGGGFAVTAGSPDDQKISVVQSYPSSTTDWTVRAIETTSIPGAWGLEAYAVCGFA
jgi:hypothetical protein